MGCQRQLTVNDDTEVASGVRDGDTSAEHQDVVAVVSDVVPISTTGSLRPWDILSFRVCNEFCFSSLRKRPALQLLFDVAGSRVALKESIHSSWSHDRGRRHILMTTATLAWRFTTQHICIWSRCLTTRSVLDFQSETWTVKHAFIWSVMLVWSKERILIQLLSRFVVAQCSGQLTGPADWAFVRLEPLRCS